MLSETESSVFNTEQITVVVLPGFSEQTKLVYPGRGHEAYAAKPSDLVISFVQKPMENYSREGDNLIYTHTLTLADALEMKPIAVPTLDNRMVYVAQDEVVGPQSVF